MFSLLKLLEKLCFHVSEPKNNRKRKKIHGIVFHTLAILIAHHHPHTQLHTPVNVGQNTPDLTSTSGQSTDSPSQTADADDSDNVGNHG